MPFAGYQDFAACVAANGDKSDPKAYCAAIQSQAEKRFTVAKADAAKGLVYGWANQIVDSAGALIEDSQGDVITPNDLEDAVVEFMLDYRKSGEMHQGLAKGTVVESFVFSPEKATIMGLPEVAKSALTGWWIGVKVHDPEVFAKVQDGTYTMFSIQGEAQRVTV